MRPAAPARPMALADGASHVRGIRGWLGLLRRWPRLRKELMAARGYVAHRIYLAGPTTVGLLTWWEDRTSLVRFAHGPAHHDVWIWAVDKNRTRGGWLATYELQGGGALWGSGTPLAGTFAGHVPVITAAPPTGCPAHGAAT